MMSKPGRYVGLVVPYPRAVGTMNKILRMHWAERDRVGKSISACVADQVVSAGHLPVSTPVVLSAVPVLQRAPMPDPDAVAWLAKVVLDSVVRLGLLPEDTGSEVTACSMHAPIHAPHAPMEFLYLSLTHNPDVSDLVRASLIESVDTILGVLNA